MKVHVNWSVAHTATETRNESCAVMAQRSLGSGQEGEISDGSVGGGSAEKSKRRHASKRVYSLGLKQLTCPGKVIEEDDANDKCDDKE